MFPEYTNHNPNNIIMDKGNEMLEAILLLQEMDTPQKLPLSHYVLDYTLTALYLTAYGSGIYLIIKWLWA